MQNGNGATIAGIRPDHRSGVDDMRAFDALPVTVRRRLTAVAVDLSATKLLPGVRQHGAAAAIDAIDSADALIRNTMRAEQEALARKREG